MRNDPVWGPLFRPDRNNGVNSGRPIDQVGDNPINLDAMRSPVYQDTGTGDAGFCANTDGGVHGAVHVDVGTDVGMGDVPWAANDPIFWLHHCTIDRIWASWNKAGGKNPSDLGFMNETFTFADGAGNRVQSKVADVLDTAPLNYVYDRYLDRPPGSVPFPQPGAVVAFSSHASSRQVSGPVALGGAPTTVSLAAPAAPAAKAPSGPSLAVTARAGRNFYLRLDGLRAATQPGVAYDVYLDLPEGVTPDRSNASYVGSVNFFAAVVHGAHAAGHAPAAAAKKSYSLVATDTVRKLQEAGRLTEAPRVTLVPTGAPRQGAAPTISSIALLSSS
jgi:tyrosinase